MAISFTAVTDQGTPHAAPATRRRRRRPRRRDKLAGWAYAAPTAVFVLIFFVVPIGIVARMSASDWTLFGGDRGWNTPENYQKALALANQLGMRPLQAHCHVGLSRLYRRRGGSEEASAAVGAARELFRAMEMTFWLHDSE